MEIKDFQTPQSIWEAQQMITAAGVILRVAYAEVASTNALCDKKVFSESESKSLESSIKKILSLMGKSAKAYGEKYSELSKVSEKVN